MLQWFVSANEAQRGLDGHLICEDSVETRPRRIHDGAINDKINIAILQKYFDTDAWLCVQNVLSVKIKQCSWLCVICQNILQDRAVMCDHCLGWYDYACCGINKTPKAKYWYCAHCIDEHKCM